MDSVEDSGDDSGGGTQFEVDQLARTWLVRGQQEDDYAFHMYLLFDDSGDAGDVARRAAMRAVLKLFDDVEELDASDLDATTLAMLAVPIKSKLDILEAIAGDSAMRLEITLASYDYQRAQSIAGTVQNATQRKLPRVSLIGYPEPLTRTRATKIDLRQLYIVDLRDPKKAETLIRDLRSSLVSTRSSLSDTHESAAESARSILQVQGVLGSSYFGGD